MRRRLAPAYRDAAGRGAVRAPATGVPPPLASLVVAALDQGVVVLDREERAILVNPAAREMGVLDADTLSFPALVGVARRSLESGAHLTATVDLPIGRLGREPIA